MNKFLGCSPSMWIVIAVLVTIASGVGAMLLVQLDKAQREQETRQQIERAQRDRAATAAAINKREQEAIKKMPDFKLLRN